MVLELESAKLRSKWVLVIDEKNLPNSHFSLLDMQTPQLATFEEVEMVKHSSKLNAIQVSSRQFRITSWAYLKKTLRHFLLLAKILRRAWECTTQRETSHKQ